MRYFCYICSEFPNSCAIVSTAPAICLYVCLRKTRCKDIKNIPKCNIFGVIINFVLQ